MSNTPLKEQEEARRERLSGNFGGQLLGNKLPEEDYPALVAQNIERNVAAFMVAAKTLEIIDLKRKVVIEKGDRRELVKKYELDFVSEDQYDKLIGIYEEAMKTG